MSKHLFIPNEKAMLALGERIAKACKPGDFIYLQGELGAGKTTITRGFLRAFGITGSIKSPSFTLIESYQVDDTHLFHFDFYRIKDPKELLEIGLEDYFTGDAICLVEWPEKAGNYLPDATRYCTIEIPENGDGRWVTLR